MDHSISNTSAPGELGHLELLAELDALGEALRAWMEMAPTWQPAESCRRLVHRLLQRSESLRVRLEAPLEGSPNEPFDKGNDHVGAI